MNGCDSRSMLDRYIYDYMIKKQMRGTPEIFGREATLTLESGAGGIDVPEGFLYEWWLIFYETFMASQPNNGSFSGSYPTLMATFPQQTAASLISQSVMNEEMTRDLAINTNPSMLLEHRSIMGFLVESSNGYCIILSKLVVTVKCSVTICSILHDSKANHLPQNPVPLPYQQNPSTFSSTLNPVVVTDDLISQGGAHLMPPGLDSYLKFLV